jgi:hypothetical protein
VAVRYAGNAYGARVTRCSFVLQVTRADFDRALYDVRPAFGIKEDELSRCFANGVISTGSDFDSVYMTLQRLVHQVMHSERSPLVSVVLSGGAGSGKSALAAKLGMESGFPFVKRISGEKMLNLTELGKAEVVTKVCVCVCVPEVWLYFFEQQFPHTWHTHHSRLPGVQRLQQVCA